MNPDIQNLQNQIKEQGAKIDAIYNSIEKMRKYFLITMWVTIIVIVLPLIGLVFAVPSLIDTYSSALSGAGQ